MHLPEPVQDLVTAPAPARHPRRDRPAGVAGLGQGGVRADPREDHARALRTSSATTSTCTDASSRSARSVPGPGPRRPRHHLAGGRPLRRAGPRPHPPRSGAARATRPSRTPGTRPTSSCTSPPRPTASRPTAPSRPRRRRPAFRSPTWRAGSRNVRTTLRRPGPAAAPPLDQPVLDRDHRQRPHLLGLLPERGAARPLADPHRAAALLPRSPRVHRLRRVTCPPTSRSRARTS